MRGLNLEDSGKKLTKFDEVHATVNKLHSFNNKDVIVEMDKLRITPELFVEIPTLGTYEMTDWAKKQLGHILGVQWNKWFNPKYVNHQRVQDEIQYRFSKTGETKKLRTRQFQPGIEKAANGSDGVLRAILGSTYHNIDDCRLFDRLEEKYGEQIRELTFVDNHLHKNGGRNDHCNNYTIVADPINLGSLSLDHPNAAVALRYQNVKRQGKKPADWIYPGFHIRNSEVGYTAITIDEFALRLICLNGCMISIGESRLMYRQHRPIEDAILDKQLGDVFANAPHRWECTRQKLNYMQTAYVAEPTKIIDDFLLRDGAPLHFRNAALEAYRVEPLDTQYGVLQALMLAAQEYDDVDRRFEFESVAGRFMSHV